MNMYVVLPRSTSSPIRVGAISPSAAHFEQVSELVGSMDRYLYPRKTLKIDEGMSRDEMLACKDS